MDCSTPGFPIPPTPGVHSNSCPLSQWCHPTISSSVVPFSYCFQSFPASGSFQMSQFFTSGGQSIRVSASTSVLPSIRVFSKESVLRSRWPKYWSFSFSISPSNEYSEFISFRIDWFETLMSLFQHHSSKASILQCSAFLIVQLTSIDDYWKNHSFD